MFSFKKSIIRREKYVFLPPRQWELVTVTLACIRQAPVSHVQVKMKVVSPMSPDPALGLVTWLQWSETDDNWLMILTELVIDPHHHGQCGPQGYDARDGVSPGSLAVLNLHPTVNIVSWNMQKLRAQMSKFSKSSKIKTRWRESESDSKLIGPSKTLNIDMKYEGWGKWDQMFPLHMKYESWNRSFCELKSWVSIYFVF